MAVTRTRIIGDKLAADKMTSRAKKIANRRKTIKLILTDASQVTKANFRSSGRSHDPPDSWVPLSPERKAWKRKKGKDFRPLILTGALRRDWVVLITTSATGELKSTTPYGVYHQEGRGHLPPRPFLIKPSHAMKIAKRHTRDHIKVSIK